MKPFSLACLAGNVVLAFASLSALGQNGNGNDNDNQWNHFGLNFRSGFLMKAKFAEAPASLALPPGPGAGPALNHQYNDGFVNVDSSGNQGGLTWNWGYQNTSQISAGDVLMHAIGSAGASGDSTDDPNLGVDFNYIRDIAHFDWGQLGIKIAFGYTSVRIDDHDALGGSLETVTDAYPLNGVVPPVAPYSGSASGPGPVIGSQPVSRTVSITPGVGDVIGNHLIDASLYDWRLGPALNIPLGNRFSFQGGGGFALGLVSSRFTYADTSPVFATGSNDRTCIVPGAYAEVGFAYRVCRAASIFTGAQYQYLDSFHQSAGGRSAELDFSQALFYELGLEWHF